MADEQKDATAGRPEPEENAGQSGGGAYPNPHDEKDKDEGGFHGGQSVAGYFGKGQLGDEDVGDTPNAPAKED